MTFLDQLNTIDAAEREQARRDFWRFATLAADAPDTRVDLDAVRRTLAVLGLQPRVLDNMASLIARQRDARRRADDTDAKRASREAAQRIVEADRRVAEARAALEQAERDVESARSVMSATAFAGELCVEARREAEQLELQLAASGCPEFGGAGEALAAAEAERITAAARAQRQSVVLATEREEAEFTKHQRALLRQPNGDSDPVGDATEDS